MWWVKITQGTVFERKRQLRGEKEVRRRAGRVQERRRVQCKGADLMEFQAAGMIF